MPKKRKQQARLQRKKAGSMASLAPVSRAIKQLAEEKRNAEPLNEDQQKWMDTFGTLDDYMDPEARKKAMEEDRRRHGEEAASAPPPVKASARAVVGVYQNHNSFAALVVRVGAETVHYITMRKWEQGSCTSGPIVMQVESHAEFVREFKFYLPHYPLRRAARIFLESYQHKTDEARRELRAVLAR